MTGDHDMKIEKVSQVGNIPANGGYRGGKIENGTKR